MTLKIGDLAHAAATNVELIRYYERIGLLPAPERTESGRRAYSADAVGRLSFIRRARELGFPLEDVRELLELAENRDAPCGEVSAMADRLLADVARKVHDLERLRARLTTLRDQCQGEGAPDCPIIDALIADDRH